jgi:hypothetical protein
MPLGSGIRPAVEAQRVGEDERGHAEHRVGEDVKRDEQAVVAVYHAPAPRSARSSRRRSASRLKRSACGGWRPCRTVSSGLRDRVGERLGAGSSTRVRSRRARPSRSAPPRPSATTGRPHACASSGDDAEVLFAGSSVTAARGTARESLVGTRPRNSHVARRGRARARALGPSPAIFSGTPASGRRRWRHRCACRDEGRDHERETLGSDRRDGRNRCRRRINHSRSRL